MDRNKQKRIISIILSFMLSMILFLSVSAFSIYLSFFNKDYVTKQFISENYINGLYSDFMDKMESLATPSYIEKQVYAEVFTKEKFSDVTLKYFTRTLNQNTQYNILENTKELQTELLNNLLSYCDTLGIEKSEAIKANIKEFVDLSFKYFSDYVSIPYIDYYAKICNSYKTPVFIAACVTLMFVALISYVLIKLNRHHSTKYEYLSYSFFAAALMNGVAPFYLFITKKYLNLGIHPEYMYDVVVNLIVHTQNALFISTLILFVLGLLSVGGTLWKRKKK